MLKKYLLSLLSVGIMAGAVLAQNTPAKKLYELRSYVSNPGKQAAVLNLIETGGVQFMAKHHIELIAAWVAVDAETGAADPKDERVFTLVAHKDKATADNSWAAFQADEGWKDVLQKSVVDGVKPVRSFERIFLTENDYSPALSPKSVGNRVFELRTYVATKGNLAALNSRFRDHTLKLFEKHGMTNIAYWSAIDGQPTTCGKMLEALSPLGKEQAEVDPNTPSAGNALVYFLAHASPAAAKASFGKFRTDADWEKALKGSEAAAGGPLTVKGGVKSLFLAPASFSPLK
jgi:hypothetical protein